MKWAIQEKIQIYWGQTYFFEKKKKKKKKKKPGIFFFFKKKKKKKKKKTLEFLVLVTNKVSFLLFI